MNLLSIIFGKKEIKPVLSLEELAKLRTEAFNKWWNADDRQQKKSFWQTYLKLRAQHNYGLMYD